MADDINVIIKKCVENDSSKCREDLIFKEDGTVFYLDAFFGNLTQVDSLNCCKSYYWVDDDGLCYWCPPKVKTICGMESYVDSLTDIEVNNVSTILGWNSNTQQTQRDWLESILTNFFPNECFILDNQNKMISNSECCRLRGGRWVFNETLNTYYCINSNIYNTGNVIMPSSSKTSSPSVPQKTYCDESHVDEYHVWVDSSNNPISQICCTQLGKQYNTNGSILVYRNGNFFGSKNDYVALSKYKSYCTDCPTSINIVGDYVYNNVDNVGLNEKCCVDYDFTYDNTNSKCVECPSTTLNSPQPDGSTIITTTSGNQLPKTCCIKLNKWFNDTLNKCYLCPPSDDNGYTFNTGSVYTEITYQGTSLTQECCDYYKKSMSNYGSNINWDANLGKCLIKNN